MSTTAILVQRGRDLPVAMVLLLGALGAMGPLSIDMYLPALPTIAAGLGIGEAGAQRSLSAYFAGLAVGQLAVGPLSDRWGRRTPLIAGLVLYVAGSCGCALAEGGWTLIASRFAQALGGAAAMVVPRALLRDLQTGAAAASTASHLQLVGAAAPLAAPLLGGWLLALAGWRSIFAVLAGVGVVLLLATAAVLGGHERRTAPVRRWAAGEGLLQGLAALLDDRAFIAYTLGGACLGAAMFAYITGAAPVFITRYGVDPAHFGWFFTANLVGLIGAGQLNRLLLRRFALLSVLRVAVLAAAAAAGILLLCAATGLGGLWGLAGSLFGFLSCLGLVGPNAGILALDGQGERAGLAAAVAGAGQFLLAAVAAWGVSCLNDGSPLAMGLVVAVCAWSAAAILLAAGRPSGRFSADPTT